MDISRPSVQHQDISSTCAFLLDCENLLEQSYSMSDAGYHSGCGSLSPASSVDSDLFSPPFLHFDTMQESFPQSPTFISSTSASTQRELKNIKSLKKTGRPRSKFPGLKRQNASEREKLRMRDLTKALNNLRTYLPPSVAPVGQNLTKIETLRLTIRYISHLSTQLSLSKKDACGNLTGMEHTPNMSAIFQTENFYPILHQSFSSQDLFSTQESFQNAHNEALFLSQTQACWSPQQQYSFYGQL